MKKLLCFFMVALFAALLVVPCFAAETTVDRGDPVDWFGGTSIVVDSYSVSISSEIGPADSASYLSFASWLYQIGAIDSDSAIGSFKVFANGTQYSSRSLHSPDGVSVYSIGYLCSYIMEGSATVSSSSGYNSAVAIGSQLSIDAVTSEVPGGGGFVDSGFSDALSELSIIVFAILSNQYILIAIGLAVAVPLVAWGISKIKSLVKGY